MTAIEELLFIAATCVLFSLKFSSLLPDFFVVEKHLKDYFQKKIVDVLFKKVTRIPTTTILFCTTYWGFMLFFCLFGFLFVLILWLKKNVFLA